MHLFIDLLLTSYNYNLVILLNAVTITCSYIVDLGVNVFIGYAFNENISSMRSELLLLLLIILVLFTALFLVCRVVIGP